MAERERLFPTKYFVPISTIRVAHEINPPKMKSSLNYPCSTRDLSLNFWVVSKKQKYPAGEASRHRDLT